PWSGAEKRVPTYGEGIKREVGSGDGANYIGYV
ncbi:unnamed protein product, partial [marine sediment metagenome]